MEYPGDSRRAIENNLHEVQNDPWIGHEPEDTGEFDMSRLLEEYEQELIGRITETEIDHDEAPESHIGIVTALDYSQQRRLLVEQLRVARRAWGDHTDMGGVNLESRQAIFLVSEADRLGHEIDQLSRQVRQSWSPVRGIFAFLNRK